MPVSCAAPLFSTALNTSISITRDVTVRMGVDNLFDKAPPLVNVNPNPIYPGLPGGAISANNYDIVGRRFYFGLTTKF